IQFHFTQKWLGESGFLQNRKPLARGAQIAIWICALLALGTIAAIWSGEIHIDPPKVARLLRNVISAAAILYFIIVFAFYKLDASEKRRIGLIVILFLAAALFWAGFEQVGSSFNLFAERYTDRSIF